MSSPIFNPLPSMQREPQARPWLAMCGGGLVVLVILGASAFWGRGGPEYSNSAAPLPLDAYAGHVTFTNPRISTANNFAGSRVTYVEGMITNSGDRTLTNAMLEVIFKSGSGEIAQVERLPLPVVRKREPYVSTGLLSLQPLTPGGSTEFRLTFERLSRDWNQHYPELRVISTSLQ